MTYPTSGPVETKIQMGSPPSASVKDVVRRYKQVPPWDLELPFYRDLRYFGAVEKSGLIDNTIASFNANVIQTNSGAFPLRSTDSRVINGIIEAQNKARADFFSQLGENPMVAQTIAEWQQTASMMGGKLLSIARAANALRRGNVRGAATALSPTLADHNYKPWIKKWSKRSYRTIPKWFGAAWLELHFGWVPLAQDVYGVIELFSFARPEGKITGRASIRESFDFLARQNYTGGYDETKGLHHVQYACRMSAHWQISSPGLFLLNRTGLLNPLSVAWELVPFSFVVDWFMNVGQCINSATDYAGLKLRNSSYTVLMRDSCVSSIMSYSSNKSGYYLLYGNKAKTRSMYVERKLGIPNVTFRAPALKRISFVRAATAIALLLNGLRK